MLQKNSKSYGIKFLAGFAIFVLACGILSHSMPSVFADSGSNVYKTVKKVFTKVEQQKINRAIADAQIATWKATHPDKINKSN